ncbi:MAG: cytochrome B6 [Gammaproteobacteria bacterium]|nr:cytochrome B6 [Gammaproteobacteria bacterium]HJP19601.1 cytochrome-c peroxidase [Nitrospinota bacterium]|tara:strand:+ start:4669 stop:5691 length:1023 start_codon:yes stop_codon:yes gene_type:complete
MGRHFIKLLTIIALCFLLFLPWLLYTIEPKRQQKSLFPAETAGVSDSNGPILPLPLQIDLDKEKVQLGKKLFHDTRLSGDNKVSCSLCHIQKKGFADGLIRSKGVKGYTTSRNTPTVFNISLHFKFHWDGRTDTLENQVKKSIRGSSMGSSWEEVIDRLSQDPEYVAMFANLYPDGIQNHNVQDAIAVYERSLITPNSRFDKFLRGDRKAITEEEKDGYRLFKRFGCVSCHQGMTIGGNMFQTFGVMGDYFADRGNITKTDHGRFNVTGIERDRFLFKVPSLRNVALTAPYFHDGDAKTLKDAVHTMAKYQLGRIITEKEAELIVKFLNTLTGEYNEKSL